MCNKKKPNPLFNWQIKVNTYIFFTDIFIKNKYMPSRPPSYSTDVAFILHITASLSVFWYSSPTKQQH